MRRFPRRHEPATRCLITVDRYTLTCLAPDVVEAILDGRQPKGLKLAEMLGNGSLSWEVQRDYWGLF